MVKKRGYRIELGEIESALYRHEGVDRAAVVAKADDAGVSIAAFVAMKPDRKGSIIAMKRHCTLYLPHYMVPDSITFLPDLPTTSTDKVDYQGLKRLAAEPRRVRETHQPSSGQPDPCVRRSRQERQPRWKGRTRETARHPELEVPVLRAPPARLAPAGPAACDAVLAGLGRAIGAALAPPALGAHRRAGGGSAMPWAPTGAPRRSGPSWRPPRSGSWPATTRSTAISDAEALATGSTSRASRPSRPRSSASRGRSWWGATWGATSRRCTGSTAGGSRSGCWSSARGTSRPS